MSETQNPLRPGDVVSGREAIDRLPDGAVVQVVQDNGLVAPEPRIIGSDVGAGLVEYERGVSRIHRRYLVQSIPSDSVEERS